jgi:hypothetical protein
MRLRDWLCCRQVWAVIVNITMLVFLVLLLRTRSPLQELYAQIRKGMSRTEVVRLLGSPTNDWNTEVTFVITSHDSPPIPVTFRRYGDAAYVEFSLPANTDLKRSAHDSYWVDADNVLVINLEDNLVQEMMLLPVTIRPATFQEWWQYHWQRLRHALSH